MDVTRFDALARAWCAASRRGLLGGLGVLALAVVLGREPESAVGARDDRRKRIARRRRARRQDVGGESKKKKGGGKKGGAKKKKKQGGAGSGTSPVRCVPTRTCAGIECGAFPDDGCGRILDCGNCGPGKFCQGTTCVCAGDCCQGSDCASGRCNAATNTCCPPVETTCGFAGAQCGSIQDSCLGGTVDCGSCTGGQFCNQNNQCEEPCPSGEIRCFGVCRTGVCCEDSDCPGASVCKSDGTCCQPEHQSATCFPTSGAPYCGIVDNNCGVGVNCGGCPASNEICAPENRCQGCPVGTQAIDDECCPDSRVCNVSGRLRCCQGADIYNDASICCGNGAGCGKGAGSNCRRPGSQGSCCPGLFCQFQGIDGGGEYGRCV